MISRNDLHWLAGWMEGEGSFGIHRPKRTKSRVGNGCAVVQGVSTDIDVAKRVALLFGVRSYGPYSKPDPKHKQYYRIQKMGNTAAGWMMTLYPLMSSRRQARIRECLAVWKTIRRRGSNQYQIKPYVEHDPK